MVKGELMVNSITRMHYPVPGVEPGGYLTVRDIHQA